MADREVQDSWRLYLLNWMPLLAMALALVISLAVTKFSLKIDPPLLLGLGLAWLLVAAGQTFWRKGYPRLAFVFGSSAQLELSCLLAIPLSYVAASANLPLQDASFAHFDRLFGLDWRGYYEFVCARPALVPYFYVAYAMISLPTFGVPILLGWTKNYARLQQFTLACTLTAVVTILVSALLPAIGTYQQYGIPADTPVFTASGYLVQVDEIPAVRDGSLRLLSFETLTGIVTFPSFHASAAVLAFWALWGVWWMRSFALIAYGGMLLATPLVGGHYFVDVFVGCGVAILAIMAARLTGEKAPARVPAITQSAATA